MKQQNKDICYFLVFKELLIREEFETVKDILLCDQLIAADSTERVDMDELQTGALQTQ